jgi:hypothetical protein
MKIYRLDFYIKMCICFVAVAPPLGCFGKLLYRILDMTYKGGAILDSFQNFSSYNVVTQESLFFVTLCDSQGGCRIKRFKMDMGSQELGLLGKTQKHLRTSSCFDI